MSPVPPLIRALLVTTWLVVAPLSAWAQTEETAPDPPVLPGDLVALRVLQEPELSGDFLVDQHHLVTLPLMGEVDVRGETELSLRARVREALRTELRNPSIQLLVRKRVRILGAVIEPGLVHLDATMSVADALAAAGGRTPDASQGTVILRRDGESVRTDVFEDASLGRLSIRSGDELLVPQRDWIDRNAGAVISGITGALGILVGLLIR